MPEEKIFPSDDEEERETLDEQNAPLDSDNYEKTLDSIELRQSRKRALLEFRYRVEESIIGDYLFGKKDKLRRVEKNNSSNNNDDDDEKEVVNLKELTIWGVPLLPSKGQDGTNIVLLKFLRARDFNVSEAFKLLKKILKWRKDFDIEGICDEDLGSGFENMVFIDGEDKQGRPVCYNLFGAFKDKELYKAVFGTEDKRRDFLRWKIQFMEKGMKKLRFKPDGVHSVLQIIDLKNSPGPAMKELRSLNKKTMTLFCDNYPELIFRTIFVNVPVWYMLSYALQSQFLSQGTKSKFIFARPARVTQTLLKYIAIERLPIQYGGLKREKDDEFSIDDKVTSLVAKGLSLQTIQVPVAEPGVTVIWDMTVVGFEATYKEEFIPDDDCSYNVLIQDEKKMKESIRNSFYINEPGKIVITIDNGSSKNKKIFFRHKKKPTLPVYMTR